MDFKESGKRIQVRERVDAYARWNVVLAAFVGI
jgi:hypothetical protein